MQTLASLAVSVATQEAKAVAGRARRGTVLYAIAGVFGLTAYALLIAAGIYGLWMLSGSFWEAALYGGLGFLVAALIPVAVVGYLNRREARRLARQRQAAALAAATAALGLLPRLIDPKTGLAAAAAGCLAYYLCQCSGSEAEDDD